MRISFVCPYCDINFNAIEASIGTFYHCRACKRQIELFQGFGKKPPFNNTPHIILTLFCLGWLLVWLIAWQIHEQKRPPIITEARRPGEKGPASSSSSATADASSEGDGGYMAWGCLAILVMTFCCLPLVGILTINGTKSPDPPGNLPENRDNAVAQQKTNEPPNGKPPKIDPPAKSPKRKEPPVELPKRIFTPILSARIGAVDVDFVSGTIGPLAYKRSTNSGIKDVTDPVEHFIIAVRITNISKTLPLKYVRWHTKNTLIVKDEFATAYEPWVAGVGSWPVGGLTETAKIEPGKSVVDVFAFVAPPNSSQEIDISLPVENFSANGVPLGKGKRFAFKIGRTYFEKK